MSLQLGELILNYERDAKKAASVYKKALSIDENNTKVGTMWTPHTSNNPL